MKKIVFALSFVFIIIFGFSIYKVSKSNNVNLDNISIPKYDFETYTIVTPTNKLQVIDASGKVLNDYDLENTISTELMMKYYNSDEMLFYGTSHDSGSKNYNVFGTYDIKTKEISYTESYRNASMNRVNFKIEELPLYLITIDPDRYRMYRLNECEYLYDNKLNKGVRINGNSGMSRKYIPLTENTGFFHSSNDTLCFVDFEKQSVKYNPYKDLQIMSVYGIYDNKLLSCGTNEEGRAKYLLVDEDFNSTILCEDINVQENSNYNDEDYYYTTNFYFIKEDMVLINQCKMYDENDIQDTMTSYIDLSKDTPEMVNLTTIENNGKGFYLTLYADEENVYLYSRPEPNKFEFLILDVDTLEVVKTIPIKKSLVREPKFDVPIILQNY